MRVIYWLYFNVLPFAQKLTSFWNFLHYNKMRILRYVLIRVRVYIIASRKTMSAVKCALEYKNQNLKIICKKKNKISKFIFFLFKQKLISFWKFYAWFKKSCIKISIYTCTCVSKYFQLIFFSNIAQNLRIKVSK